MLNRHEREAIISFEHMLGPPVAWMPVVLLTSTGSSTGSSAVGAGAWFAKRETSVQYACAIFGPRSNVIYICIRVYTLAQIVLHTSGL
jgi:hypothetical protein